MTESPPTLTTSTLDLRVYYEDTDAGTVVYHSNFLKFAERGRTEMLRQTGYDHRRLTSEFGILLVVRHIEIDYRAPGRLDDMLRVTTHITKIGNTSMGMQQIITRDEKTLAELKVTVVAMTPEGRAVRIPPQLRPIFVPLSVEE